jgi:sulfoxide reductase heme-binding subunit YedZ
MPNPSLAAWLPWTDRAGRPSRLKFAVFAATLAPALWMVFEWHMGWFSVKPLTDTIRESGDWALRLLVASLAVTPLRLVTRWNRLILVRRMLGLAALFYTLVHVVLYCVDLRLDFVAILSEIVLRTYLTVGTVATVGLLALGLTSNDLSIHRLGGARWNLLHSSVYATAVLSLLHEFMEVKIDSYEVSLLTGIFVLLMGVRRLRKTGLSLGFAHLLGLAAAAGLATALIEAGFYALSTGVNARLVLAANLDFSYVIRPAWWVVGTGICLAVLSLFCRVLQPRSKTASGGPKRPSVVPVAFSGEPPRA